MRPEHARPTAAFLRRASSSALDAPGVAGVDGVFARPGAARPTTAFLRRASSSALDALVRTFDARPDHARTDDARLDHARPNAAGGVPVARVDLLFDPSPRAARAQGGSFRAVR